MSKKQTKILSSNYTGHSLVIVYSDGRVHTKIVEKSHPNWRGVERAYKANDLNKVLELIDVTKAINSAFNGEFVVKNGKVYRGDDEVNGYLFDQIIFFMREGLQYKRLLAFAQNLYSNPSTKAREELYKFLEHKHMPITDDGCFLAYKGVQSDYYSRTGGTIEVIKGKVNKDGKIFNGVGEEIEVKRAQVNDNVNIGCAAGLHAGSHAYANDFKNGGHLMIVKINPRDCVSVPNDCSCQKLRTCRYEVIAEENEPLHEIKHSNLDKTAKFHNKRDASGKFCRV
jgi:hypothetical protein